MSVDRFADVLFRFAVGAVVVVGAITLVQAAYRLGSILGVWAFAIPAGAIVCDRVGALVVAWIEADEYEETP